MARSLGPAPPPPARAEGGGARFTAKEYHIEVVTPLFGGGVEARKNDPVTLIRGSAVRGHLRFWWRATRGAGYSDAKALKAAEDAIWGSASTPSKVSIALEVLEDKRDAATAFAHPGYATFPFREDVKRGLRVGRARFNLRLTWRPEAEDDHVEVDVEAAMWAWANFGGLGARVRRGCGALYCRELAPPARRAEIPRWYEEKMARFGGSSGDSVRAWPTLQTTPECMVIGDLGTPISAWAAAVKLLQDFRQGPGVGRRGGGGNKPGTSRWPEPNAIRRIVKSPPVEGKNPHSVAFPRAELGLPIVFHFKESDRHRDEPKGVTLIPDGDRQRMASPLVFKPLCVSPQEAYPVILRLRTMDLDAAILQYERDRKNESLKLTASHIRAPHVIEAGESPVKGRSRRGSALDAFMEFARERWGG